MENNSTPMFGGTSENKQAYTPFTGLASFNILAVNPTKAQIEEITGRTYPFDVTYDLRQDSDQNMVRPIEFWVKCKENNVIDKLSFQLGNTLVKSKTENFQFINAKGVSRYAGSLQQANEKYAKMAPFVRELYVGEDALYAFMQRALGYKSSEEGAQFLLDCEAAGITQQNLYQGNVEGLRNFIGFVNSKNRRVGLVFGVKQKDKLLDNGTKTIQNRQVILNNPDFFFTLATGSVEDYNRGKLQEAIDDKVKNSVSLGTALFTVNLQKFVKEECINVVPENPITNTSAIKWG